MEFEQTLDEINIYSAEISTMFNCKTVYYIVVITMFDYLCFDLDYNKI